MVGVVSFSSSCCIGDRNVMESNIFIKYAYKYIIFITHFTN